MTDLKKGLPPNEGFMNFNLVDYLECEIDNLLQILTCDESEWSEECKKLNAVLNTFSYTNDEKWAFALSRQMTQAKAKRHNLPVPQGKNESRNREIIIWCDLYRSKGMNWTKDPGGIYYEVGEKYGLSATAIEGIYKVKKDKK